jgi:cyclopropane-fatty-acyl-phospholipid synthase
MGITRAKRYQLICVVCARVIEKGMPFFEELLRDFHPRNFAVRLWDGLCLDAELGQYASCTLVINHPGAMYQIFLPANQAA